MRSEELQTTVSWSPLSVLPYTYFTSALHVPYALKFCFAPLCRAAGMFSAPLHAHNCEESEENITVTLTSIWMLAQFCLRQNKQYQIIPIV